MSTVQYSPDSFGRNFTHWELYQHGELTDLDVVVVGPRSGRKQVFHVHSVVLAGRSPVLHNQLVDSSTKRLRQNYIERHDFEPEDFEVVLQMVYTGDVQNCFSNDVRQLCELLYAARELQLRETYANDMLQNVSGMVQNDPQAAMQLLNFGTRKLQCVPGQERLVELACDVLSKHMDEVLDGDCITTATAEAMATLLSLETYAPIDEMQFVRALDRWAQAQRETHPGLSKSELVGDLIRRIRFSLIPVDQLGTEVRQTGLLPDEVLLDILTKDINRGIILPFPSTPRVRDYSTSHMEVPLDETTLMTRLSFSIKSSSPMMRHHRPTATIEEIHDKKEGAVKSKQPPPANSIKPLKPKGSMLPKSKNNASSSVKESATKSVKIEPKPTEFKPHDEATVSQSQTTSILKKTTKKDTKSSKTVSPIKIKQQETETKVGKIKKVQKKKKTKVKKSQENTSTESTKKVSALSSALSSLDFNLPRYKSSLRHRNRSPMRVESRKLRSPCRLHRTKYAVEISSLARMKKKERMVKSLYRSPIVSLKPVASRDTTTRQRKTRKVTQKKSEKLVPVQVVTKESDYEEKTTRDDVFGVPKNKMTHSMSTSWNFKLSKNTQKQQMKKKHANESDKGVMEAVRRNLHQIMRNRRIETETKKKADQSRKKRAEALERKLQKEKNIQLAKTEARIAATRKKVIPPKFDNPNPVQNLKLYVNRQKSANNLQKSPPLPPPLAAAAPPVKKKKLLRRRKKVVKKPAEVADVTKSDSKDTTNIKSDFTSSGVDIDVRKLRKNIVKQKASNLVAKSHAKPRLTQTKPTVVRKKVQKVQKVQKVVNTAPKIMLPNSNQPQQGDVVVHLDQQDFGGATIDDSKQTQIAKKRLHFNDGDGDGAGTSTSFAQPSIVSNIREPREYSSISQPLTGILKTSKNSSKVSSVISDIAGQSELTLVTEATL